MSYVYSNMDTAPFGAARTQQAPRIVWYIKVQRRAVDSYTCHSNGVSAHGAPATITRATHSIEADCFCIDGTFRANRLPAIHTAALARSVAQHTLQLLLHFIPTHNNYFGVSTAAYVKKSLFPHSEKCTLNKSLGSVRAKPIHPSSSSQLFCGFHSDTGIVEVML